MKAGRRAVLSLSSWFCVPEQGMKDFEILNRASAFLVRSRSWKKQQEEGAGIRGPRVHVLTASHVVAPWRWPKYYPEDWLQQVNERHTAYTLELRHDDGVFATQNELRPVSYHHAKRDLAVLHLEDEEDALEVMNELGVDVLTLTPPGDDMVLREGDALEFHGHNISAHDFSASEDTRKPLPSTSKGFVQGRTQHQIFAQTDPVLSQGMCGGPVLVKRNGQSLCAGLIEGIVPADHAIKTIQSLAVFVETPDLQGFLDDVEQGRIEPLVGGDAILVVSSDKDESKMDLQKIVSNDDDDSSKQVPSTSNFSSSPSSSSSKRRP